MTHQTPLLLNGSARALQAASLRAMVRADDGMVSTRPYRFMAPVNHTVWPRLMWPGIWLWLDFNGGVQSADCVGVEHLRSSLQQRKGIMLTPNHVRPSDPLAMLVLGHAAGTLLYSMASGHLFRQSPFHTFFIRRFGAFSVHREGVDRESFQSAVRLLSHAQRPLVLFPEGVVTLTNDRLVPFRSGGELLARTAARQAQTTGASTGVVIHPVAIRYQFRGELTGTLTPLLQRMERSLGLQAPVADNLAERVEAVGAVLLAQREAYFLGAVQTGPETVRVEALADRALSAMEASLGLPPSTDAVHGRVRRARQAVVKRLAQPGLPRGEQDALRRRIRELAVINGLGSLLPGYVLGNPTPERLLETAQHHWEMHTRRVLSIRPWHVTLTVGPAVPVSAVRNRRHAPLMEHIQDSVAAMLAANAPSDMPPRRLKPLWRLPTARQPWAA